jgi:hypothetical protein
MAAQVREENTHDNKSVETLVSDLEGIVAEFADTDW